MNGASDKKVCLFLGAGGMLGGAFCHRHAHRYAISAVARRRFPGLPNQHQRFVDPLAPEAPLQENADALFVIPADIGAPGQIERVIELTLARFGRIDVLVNSASHALWANMLGDERLAQSAEAHFHMNVIVPLRASLALARMFWRTRVDENRAQSRCVINVSSTAGVNLYPGCGQSLYSASKAALNFLTCHMAAEFAELGVRVAATAPNSFPSAVSTEAAADSIARLIDSDVTGRVLVIDRDREYFSP